MNAPGSLADTIQYLQGVGPKLLPSFQKLGIETVWDLLSYVPLRYEDRSNLPPIREVREGTAATVIGRLVAVESNPTRSRMVIQKATINDGTGSIHFTWFNQPWIQRKLEDYHGKLIGYGQVKSGRYGLEISSPEWELLDEDLGAENFARIVAIYPSTEKLNQKNIRTAIHSAWKKYESQIHDDFPPEFVRKLGVLDLKSAIRELHFPDSLRSAQEARKRLVFEEFLLLQLALVSKKIEGVQETGIRFPIQELAEGKFKPNPVSATKVRTTAGRETSVVVAREVPNNLFESDADSGRNQQPLWEQIHEILPYQLTGAQRRAVEEIFQDMSRGFPMNRLVQGDVGSGKTAVAACAILACIRSGYQAAFMAPTELLAEQHFNNLTRLFAPLEIEVETLLGKQGARQRKKSLDKTKSGEAHLVVGTHALIEDPVIFERLGLAVIDEQHRFGVRQRTALREKGAGNPDVLVMTATPIPRTLTMALYGELDTTIIDELPPGRKAIKTHWKLPSERASVYASVKSLIDQGRQAYVICPMVSESEFMMSQAATELYEYLQAHDFQAYRVGLLHGKLKPVEKEAVMSAFAANELHVLVATTVVEVGVDVPNATVIVIEDANRFGLAQLHQLRGRVGRGSHQSYCILVAEDSSDEVRKRLEVLVETTDGFRISEVDLELRGAGELVGTKQSGRVDFRFGDLVRDAALMEKARSCASEILTSDEFPEPKWDPVRSRLTEKRHQMALLSIS